MKRLTSRLGAALLVLAAEPAAAQHYSGYAEARSYGYFAKANERDPAAIAWGTILVKGEAALGARGRFVSSLRLEGISSDEAGPLEFDPADRALRRTPLTLRELYVRLPLRSGLDLQAGRFELGWGKTDGYSPADAFLPRDLSDPFADEKLPLWGARLQGQRAGLRWELYATAPATPWRMPVLEGRYAPVPIARVILVDGTSNPPHAGFAAGRLLLTHGDWDLGLWARGGERPAPLLAFRRDQVYPVDVGYAVPTDRRYVRESGAGFEVAKVQGAWVLRGELGALYSGDAELGSALLVTAGLERGVGNAIFIATLAVNLRDTPIDPALLFDRAFLPGLIAAWTQSASWGSVKLAWTGAFKHGDGLLKIDVVDHLNDRWSLNAGGDLPYGSELGPLGVLGDARRARLALRRSW